MTFFIAVLFLLLDDLMLVIILKLFDLDVPIFLLIIVLHSFSILDALQFLKDLFVFTRAFLG